MRTKLILEHTFECCNLTIKNTVYTVFDGPMDLSAKALKSWLNKTMNKHQCPKRGAGGPKPAPVPYAEIMEPITAPGSPIGPEPQPSDGSAPSAGAASAR